MEEADTFVILEAAHQYFHEVNHASGFVRISTKEDPAANGQHQKKAFW